MLNIISPWLGLKTNLQAGGFSRQRDKLSVYWIDMSYFFTNVYSPQKSVGALG
jgi:hypothetical protein